MAKSKRVIVAQIPVRLTQRELETLNSVHSSLESSSYQKTFITSLTECQYLQRENSRLEKLIDKLLHENNIEKTKWLASLTEEERQQANAWIISKEEPEEHSQGEGIPATASLFD